MDSPYDLHVIKIHNICVHLPKKRTRNVIEALMKNLMGVFGVIEALIMDNGEEFILNEMREISSILNVRPYTTAIMSPYQNGLCKRVDAIMDMMMTNLEAENNKVELKRLLSWVNITRNSLQMWNGLSSNQLVFGKKSKPTEHHASRTSYLGREHQ